MSDTQIDATPKGDASVKADKPSETREFMVFLAKLAIFVFMAFYYRVFGVVADLVLLANVVLLAALLSGVQPGMSVADICAGAGGKTLALAAMMRNEGRLVAHDLDRFRLRPIFERLTRAGVTNCEVISAQDKGKLDAAGPFDCVVIDAPCSGSGSWRRKPDAKWRLTPKQFAQRIKDQAQVLEKGFQLAKPGGTVLYITCSVLPEENTEQVAAFLSA